MEKTTVMVLHRWLASNVMNGRRLHASGEHGRTAAPTTSSLVPLATMCGAVSSFFSTSSTTFPCSKMAERESKRPLLVPRLMLTLHLASTNNQLNAPHLRNPLPQHEPARLRSAHHHAVPDDTTCCLALGFEMATAATLERANGLGHHPHLHTSIDPCK